MKTFLEYIMLHYTWFLAGAIIILLAIIGYYAERTNFGQGKTNNKEEDNNLDIEENILEDSIPEENEQEIIGEEQKLIPEEGNEKDVVEEITSDSSVDGVNKTSETLEESFEKFDKEFEEILPQKEIIDDELLAEIESLSLDKTQKIDLSDILDLDDVELPKIKDLKPENEDIWKF